MRISWDKIKPYYLKIKRLLPLLKEREWESKEGGGKGEWEQESLESSRSRKGSGVHVFALANL